MKSASVAWATREELQQAEKVRERPAGLSADQRSAPAPDQAANFWRDLAEEGSRRDAGDAGRTQAPSIHAARQAMAALAEPMDGWLILPYFGAERRDSLDRRLDPASAAAAVSKDRMVQQERASLEQYLRGSNCDPEAAKAQLDALVKSQGLRLTLRTTHY